MEDVDLWYGFLCSVRENEQRNIVKGNLLSIYCNKYISHITTEFGEILSTAKSILICAKLLQRRRYVQLMLMLYPISYSHIGLYISTNLSDCNEQPA